MIQRIPTLILMIAATSSLTANDCPDESAGRSKLTEANEIESVYPFRVFGQSLPEDIDSAVALVRSKARYCYGNDYVRSLIVLDRDHIIIGADCGTSEKESFWLTRIDSDWKICRSETYFVYQ